MAKIPIVSVYDQDGNRIEVPAIVGRSAYQSAQKLGYTGSEEEWIESLRGKDGRGIKSIVRTEGDGTPGTTDTYTITYTDNESDTFTIHNGIDRVFVEEKINQFSGEIANKLDADKLSEAINTALEQAKESGEFDGDPGTSPHVGDNGNWFVGKTDTGVQAQGDDYVLTAQDKAEIAQMAVGLLPRYNGEVENV